MTTQIETQPQTEPELPTLAFTLFDPTLAMAAESVDDLERTRIASQNRLRQLTRTGEDADGEERGYGLTLSHPAVARQADITAQLEALEHTAVLALQRAMRSHPLGPWVKAQKGVGDKQAARLLASIGDPYWNTLHDRPRTVSELWAYAGYDVRAGQGPRRRKGELANWSQAARMRARMIAESIVKSGGPYREVYDARKAATEGRIHVAPCPQCVGSSNAGDLWRDGHRHADALRVVSKTVLRDLWCEARRLHQEQTSSRGHMPCANQWIPAPTAA